MATPNKDEKKDQPQITQGGGQKKRDQFWTIVLIAVVVLILGVIIRVKYFNEKPAATASTGQMSTVLQPSQRILKLVPGGSIQWVSIPRGMCSEANPAQGCVNWFINDESTPVQLCRGIPVNVPGPSFRIGFSADQKTTVAVDLFPCN